MSSNRNQKYECLISTLANLFVPRDEKLGLTITYDEKIRICEVFETPKRSKNVRLYYLKLLKKNFLVKPCKDPCTFIFL